ncbi:MAG: hypothetical protein P9X26_02000, partial [Candidatus Stygibacter frigidus]|nr:hypothetical protein [Candidatus Stygibacter frigidus]
KKERSRIIYMLIYHSVIEHWEFRIKYISYCIYYIYDKSEILVNNKIKEIAIDWQTLSQIERDDWNKQAARYKKQRLTGFNLFTRKVLSQSDEYIVSITG